MNSSKTISALILVVCILALSFRAMSADSIEDGSLKTINVGSLQQLYSALEMANKSGFTKIILANGQYFIKKTLLVKRDHISIVSRSGDPAKAILTGNGMRATPRVDNLMLVTGKHFTLQGITLEQSGNHLIQISGEHDADFPTIEHCILQDSYEQLLKVSYNKKTQVASDYGIVTQTIFRYTAGIGPQFYIGGIDVHGGHHWKVTKNKFENIASPSLKVAEHAVHFWNNTKNILVDKNTIINSDRGIGFGMEGRPALGGVISNNLILHTNNYHPFADVGIIIEETENTQIVNNKIFLAHPYPNAIEYRFETTKNTIIENNLTNKPIRKRNGGNASLNSNNRSLTLSDFASIDTLTEAGFELNVDTLFIK
ncbi:right-handed parallel beta-helix repeat-containing protein [Paraglaciecola agarilytica]|uniref:right-handed parallel beta-helix repeat-containing protein n=1 Tax=Paraglaciecola chathamensis TaxID=368405 RepID=UPI001C0992C9|nr:MULTISPECIES: right-handed parallel beta-helix repeat-containing protein [Paraglaciecola]MBU3017170.1 right-handed parallel beta-helix repeat-containing protein [Paraglaciecola agarilytica]MDO6558272.1 right-handed parallel beta-helix repeat-containing protein [Paraglaciecola chathamensis]MDO6838881.1 right-handed parallel beta-helix repeat-containing protein [Paraglaciecola chathamensis]